MQMMKPPAQQAGKVVKCIRQPQLGIRIRRAPYETWEGQEMEDIGAAGCSQGGKRLKHSTGSRYGLLAPRLAIDGHALDQEQPVHLIEY